MTSTPGGPPGGSGWLPVEHALELGGMVSGMELSFVSAIAPETLTLTAVAQAPGAQAWDLMRQGSVFPLGDTFCKRMLDGAPRHTSNAAADPHYADVPLIGGAGITSYLGIPLRDSAGQTVGTFCAVDRDGIEIGDRALNAFALLAPAVARAAFPEPPSVTVQRTATGWTVTGAPGGDEPVEDLTSAMVLADLITTELPMSGARPPRADHDGDELARLRISVAQLEHALSARVVVEQAIGVLSERRRVSPRAAFETLRGVARGSGRKVHALALEVVSSATEGGPSLAAPLSRTARAAMPTVPAPAAPTVATVPTVPSPAAVANFMRSRVPNNP